MQKNPFERFTKEAKTSLQIAEDLVNKFWSKSIWTEHLLLWILSVPDTIAFNTLNSMWVNYQTVLYVIEKAKNIWDKKTVNWKISTYLTKIIEDSVKIAIHNKQNMVWNEHLLLWIVLNKKCAWNIVLENLEINTDEIKNQIENIFKIKNDMSWPNNWPTPKVIEDIFSNLSWVIMWWKESWGNWWMFFWGSFPWNWPDFEEEKNPKKNKKMLKSKTPALDYFSEDFTKKAIQWKLDPVIWRSKEIERVLNILNRKTKNNPVLIWEAWVWKTAIAEGLAIRIAEWNVPWPLLKKRVLNINLWDLIAWTKYRWEFEERLKDIITEASWVDSNVILFIDELHTIIWLWAWEWSLDTANILKPSLARWKIQIIWATTIDEYKKNIEKDKALDRRFQKVQVNEPSEKEAFEILEWISESFSKYHNVNIEKEALEVSVKLSKRYLPERFLPDKAIDLLDETCAKKWNKVDPKNIKEKEKIEKEIKKIEKAKEDAIKHQDYQRWVDLKIKENELIEKIDSLLNPKNLKIKKINITKEDITETLAQITWISSLKIWKDEHEKIINLSKNLEKHIIGQNDWIKKIAKTIIRNRAWVSSPNRPIWSFLFLWPTWVWKTETVKKIAEEMYESSDALIKIDMSEFWERHSVSRLVWTTAGYVWYEEWWQLTEAVRVKPYAIILFDEIEKAHPDSYNILLQILEDWYLTDWKWRKVNFKNTIVIMTSNIWAEILTQEAQQIWFATDEKTQLKSAIHHFEEKKAEVLEEIKEYFLPELLNRIDKIIVFSPLDKKNIKKIVSLQIEELKNRLKEQNIEIEISETVIWDLARISYFPEEWARKVRRIIQEIVEENLAEEIISWKIKSWDTAKLIRKKGAKDEFEIVKKK